eukprot:gnl/Dysnectes_brevis/1874_a2154_624.p2 GENE.gnl/Dysnectes_brevis/1874_a2154_624~~gnl/Dysnectes_brevis/1874_a2154_624.p2  ORF type:complete len:370 (+),score=145.66 gnl/Dysnectes_brevis/1874_a2154_624:1923-3032(+)
MPESTVIIIDSSPYSRNADQLPSRLASQQEAASTLARSSINDSPMNTVSLISMGSRPKQILPHSQNIGHVLDGIQRLRPEAQAKYTGTKVISALQMASLALKHRKHKQAACRVVMFLCSLPADLPEVLIKAAAKLKKTSIGLELVVFGLETVPAVRSTAEAMVQAASKAGNSRLVCMEPGDLRRLHDVLVSGPLMRGGPEEEDPEMAAVLRASLEEHRAQMAAQSGVPVVPPETASGEPDLSAMTEEEQLQYVLRMSEMEFQEHQEPAADVADVDADDVMQMSTTGGADEVMEEPEEQAVPEEAVPEEAVPSLVEGATVTEEDLMAVLANIPGISLDDVDLQAAITEALQDKADNADNAEDQDKDQDME